MTNPFISVKLPNGGEDYSLGDMMMITWSSEAHPGPISIELVDTIKNKSFCIKKSYQIAPEFPLKWEVGKPDKTYEGNTEPVTPGHDYKIRIKTTAGVIVSDESDNTFTISEPKKIRITYPTGQDVLTLSKDTLITWENKGGLKGNINLLLWRQGLSPYVIGSDIPVSNLKFPWEVGKNKYGAKIEPGKYCIVVLDQANQYLEISDFFTISPPASFSLVPEIKNIYYYKNDRWQNPVCGATLHSGGVTNDPVEIPPGGIMIGFMNTITSSFCFEEQIRTAYRSIIEFDLSSVKMHNFSKPIVDNAKLLLTKESTYYCHGDFVTNESCCAGRIFIMNKPLDMAAPFYGFWADATQYSTIPQHKGTSDKAAYDGGKNLEIDVTTAVQDWVDNKKPNYGFMITGVNENFHKDGDACVTTFYPVILSILLK